MAALCQAMETKDLYTRGHNEWVSRGVVMTGREIGMRASRVEAIRYARMLHDVASSGCPPPCCGNKAARPGRLHRLAQSEHRGY